MLLELFGQALRSLGRHKLRSFLTALGVIFGVASVISMVSTGEGARRAVLAQIGELGVRNVILHARRPPAEELSEEEDENDEDERYGLTFRDKRQIAATIPAIESILPVHDKPAWLWFGSRRMAARVRGVTPEYFDTFALEPSVGRVLTPVDGREHRRVCVVGRQLLRDAGVLGPPLDVLLKVDNDLYQVVGVLPDRFVSASNRELLGVAGASYRVFVPYETAIHRGGLERVEGDERVRVELDQIVCVVEDEEKVMAAARAISTILERNHKLRDFEIVVPQELLASREKTQRIFRIVLPIIAGISLLVGGIGILNIMLASVTERTREIGIRRAIGATRGDITLQFLVETVALSAVGGLLGVGLGAGFVEILDRVTDWQPAITWEAVVVSLGISCLTGMIFGIYPASRAARLDPISSLRHA